MCMSVCMYVCIYIYIHTYALYIIYSNLLDMSDDFDRFLFEIEIETLESKVRKS